ncbi:MAG: hypothetical protein M3137_06845 [Actinomycetota bacterium]|nr:hypothetical protein [Actinomycetota bacterium]
MVHLVSGSLCEDNGAFPQSAGVLLHRMGSLYGLHGELAPVRRVLEPLPAVPMEASVSLRPGAPSELRLTVGFEPRVSDPDARGALVSALSGLGAERVCADVDEALTTVAPPSGRRRLLRALAVRTRKGEPLRPRAGAWVGGKTATERSARVANAMRRVGLDQTAALHERLVTELAANPFSAIVPYGLGFDVRPDRVLGAKTYFVCEWAEVAVGLLTGRLGDELHLEGVHGFELLADSIRADARRSRWLMEVSFELSADPARGTRAKAYLLPFSLAADDAEGHIAILRLAHRLALDPRPYEQLVEAVWPGGLIPDRPCSFSVGVSADARGASLDVYLLNPGRPVPAAGSVG